MDMGCFYSPGEMFVFSLPKSFSKEMGKLLVEI